VVSVADRVSEFTAYMAARETIRAHKEAGRPPPWTDDPILAGYRFCNVFREDDKVSRWIQKNVTDRFASSPQLWIHLAIARQINWPPSLAFALREGSWPARLDTAALNRIRSSLDDWQAMGRKVYTGAYMIHADSNPATRDQWANKNHYVLQRVIGQLLPHKPNLASLQAFVISMKPYESWGGFMAYEVACDLRWAPGPYGLMSAEDIGLWANPGPGAVRGLNRLAGRPLKTPLKENQSVGEMQLLLSIIKLKRDWPRVEGARLFSRRPFEMRDVEHTLCEFDKYERVRLGEGKPRSHYRPQQEMPL